MKELNLNEMNLVSGGINCLDSEMYQNLHNQAVFSAEIAGAAGALVAGAIVFGFASPAAAGAGITAYVFPTVAASVAGAAVFPWVAIYAYAKSSVWAPYFGQK